MAVQAEYCCGSKSVGCGLQLPGVSGPSAVDAVQCNKQAQPACSASAADNTWGMTDATDVEPPMNIRSTCRA